MILTMAYFVLIAVLLGLAALPAERLCVELGWPRRGVWLAALFASIALPAYAILFVAPENIGAPILSLPQLPDFVPAFNVTDVAAVGAGTQAAVAFSWPDWQAFDSSLVVVWAVSSVAMALVLLIAGFRLRREIAKSQSTAIGDQTVLLSDSLGPAVIGLLRPRIVLPLWLAQQDTALRTFVLNHEREHISARDQLTLFAALLLVALMPWNIALWWQLRRLRAAIEVDCDQRVLRDGSDARDYSAALLTVGERSTRAPFASVALTEPVSELENRIRIMLAKARSFSVAGFGARTLLVVAIVGIATAVNAPNAQQAGDEAADTDRRIPTIRTVIYDQLSAAQVCLSEDDVACALDHLDSVRERTDLNTYEEAQLHNFYAFVHFDMDELAAAVAAYEAILALPQSEIPEGMILSTMRNLATLYLQFERYEEGLDLYDRWLAMPSVNPGADDYYLKATILYQMERYEDALTPLERAIAAAEEPEEQYYQLLYVLHFQADNEEGVIEALEILNERWPGETWANALEFAEQRAAAAANPFDSSFRFAESGAGRGRSAEYLPIVLTAPVYPPLAATRGLEGYALVSYTVTRTGTTTDIEVIESSDPIFDNAAIEAVGKYKYQPRLADGSPVDVPGVTTRIIFDLGDDAE